MTIWKYKLHASGVTVLNMPEGAKVLSVAEQHGEAVLWALVSAGRVTEERKFRTCLTGGDAPNSVMDFMGTALLDGGNYVVHVFEVK